MSESQSTNGGGPGKEPLPRPPIEETAQRELLALTRSTLQSYFQTGRVDDTCRAVHPQLFRRSGAFVTLHKQGELRGCIGLLSEDRELYRTVQRCALSAALEDSRFNPVTPEEFNDLKIEISVLSRLQRIDDVQLIQVGRHGLVVSLGGARGLLLPQVAVKYNWDRETFLAQTCRKAGLWSHAWRQPNAIIQIFEAQIISD